jgi:NTP pyrophosphatase (non-canonical NTP hydrolase)
MTIDEYQKGAISTAIYGEGNKIIYPTLGLTGEAGEVAEKVKKILRDKGGEFSDEARKAIAKELGDVMWYVAALCRDIGISMDAVAQMNLAKLQKRKATNNIHGSGDDREE